jgi:hypothetical protein
MARSSPKSCSNCGAARASWHSGNTMADHDRLPPDLRRFMIHAALPWSARSVLRLWRKGLAETGCRTRALERVMRAAEATLRRDACETWGPDHPAAAGPPTRPER